MVKPTQTLSRKLLIAIAYTVGICASIWLIAFGWSGWTSEGYSFPTYRNHWAGLSGGFYACFMGVIFAAYCIFGLVSMLVRNR